MYADAHKKLFKGTLYKANFKSTRYNRAISFYSYFSLNTRWQYLSFSTIESLKVDFD